LSTPAAVPFDKLRAQRQAQGKRQAHAHKDL
jgi:hypothetical protein